MANLVAAIIVYSALSAVTVVLATFVLVRLRVITDLDESSPIVQVFLGRSVKGRSSNMPVTLGVSTLGPAYASSLPAIRCYPVRARHSKQSPQRKKDESVEMFIRLMTDGLLDNTTQVTFVVSRAAEAQPSLSL